MFLNAEAVTGFRVHMPWGSVLGLSRSLMAMSLALTLVATPPTVLFSTLYGSSRGAACEGMRSLSAFCLVPIDQLVVVQYLTAGLLGIVVTGFWPGVLAVPFAYVIASFEWATSLPDGGDQVALIVALLLIPIGLTDRRRNHWNSALPESVSGITTARVVSAGTAATLIRVQLSIVYLVASLGKLGNSSWVEGSALYYWFRHPNFGPPEWLAGPLHWLTSIPAATAAVTWGVMAFEFALGMSMLIPSRLRVHVLLPVGILLHLAIAVVMGITSFSFIMIAALLLLLVPVGSDLAILQDASIRRQSEADAEMRDESASAPGRSARVQ
ncbi:MAG: hypothetical protein JWQ19_1525 [Subtercola sp.]|nr:hypothetical protein [Subtercola sp.]